MRRTVAFVFLLAVCLMALPVSAGVGNNPNVELVDPVCEDGLDLPLVIATGQAGHLPQGQLAGVAMSISVLDGPDGNVLLPILNRPGVGLDNLTTWCWWFDPIGVVWIGADILAHPSFR